MDMWVGIYEERLAQQESGAASGLLLNKVCIN